MRELNRSEQQQASGGCQDYTCELPTPMVELYPNLVQRRTSPINFLVPSPDPFRPIEYSQ